MATNDFKPKGQSKASKADAGGGVIRSLPVLGVVKNNIDATRGGRIQVYIADFGSPNPNDDTSWTTVSYMSPFFGNTIATSGKDATNYGSYETNSISYGMWFSPPDIGSTVVCLFINGDPNYGYYIGGVLQPELLQMIPAIGSSPNVILNSGESQSYGGATQLPVTNLNTNNSKITNSSSFLTATKPVHSYAASLFAQQGLIRDTIRGPISSSALRESPSRVGWGVSTPGRPIFQGGATDSSIASAARTSSNESLKVISRRSGHSIVMDDGTLSGTDQLIRIRTSLGHQITMSDDGQTLFIIHSNGQSYIELGKEGTIDMYSTNSFNIRTQGDLNLHADNDVNINAAKNLNIAAANIKITSEKDLSFRVGGNFAGYTLGTYSVKVNGTMSMGSGGQGSYASGADMFINGSNINLNTGSTSATPNEVASFPITAHTDSLFDKVKGWAAAPASLLSIVSRAPAHAPWVNAGQGVNVQVNNNASAKAAAPPSPTVAAANATVAIAPKVTPTAATVATVPPIAAASKALDSNTTAAMVSGVAATASATAAAAVTAGTTTVTDATGKIVAAVGVLAQTPKIMEIGQVLKVGSAPLVQALVESGSTVAAALPQNLFAGKPNAENLQAYVQNIPAQVATQVASFQQAQTALTQSGVITGNEAPGQIAGMVTAVSQVGLGATTGFLTNASNAVSGVIGAVKNVITGVGSSVSQAISSGNFSANLGTNLSGGIGSLATSLGGLGKVAISGVSGAIDAVKGVAGSAYAVIAASFKSFTPNTPQNLFAISEKNKEEQVAAEASSKVTPSTATSALASAASALSAVPNSVSGALASVSGVLSSVTGILNTAPGSAIGALTSVVSAVSRIPGVSTITGAVSASPAALASGIGALPGGASAVSSIVTANGALNNIPGVAGLSAIVNNNSTAALNNISNSVTNLLPGGLPNLDPLALLQKQSLTSLISSGLPASAAASLQASVNSLSSSSPFPIKMPIVASDTTDRTEITGQLTSLLGSSKIPLPNFSGNIQIKPLSSQQIEKYDAIKVQIDTTTDDLFAARKSSGDANFAYSNAVNSLPQGDPQLASLKQSQADAQRKITTVEAKLADLRQQQFNLTQTA